MGSATLRVTSASFGGFLSRLALRASLWQTLTGTAARTRIFRGGLLLQGFIGRRLRRSADLRRCRRSVLRLRLGSCRLLLSDLRRRGLTTALTRSGRGRGIVFRGRFIRLRGLSGRRWLPRLDALGLRRLRRWGSRTCTAFTRGGLGSFGCDFGGRRYRGLGGLGGLGGLAHAFLTFSQSAMKRSRPWVVRGCSTHLASTLKERLLCPHP